MPPVLCTEQGLKEVQDLPSSTWTGTSVTHGVSARPGYGHQVYKAEGTGAATSGPAASQMLAQVTGEVANPQHWAPKRI